MNMPQNICVYKVFKLITLKIKKNWQKWLNYDIFYNLYENLDPKI